MSYLNSPPPPFSFIPPPPHSWNSSTCLKKKVSFFHFHTWLNISTNYPLIPFLYILPHTGTNPPDRTSFIFLFSVKTDIFVYLRWLYMGSHCDIFMYICIITQLGSFPLFFSFYLSPLLMVISAGLKILYSFLYRKYINHTLLNPSVFTVWFFVHKEVLLFCSSPNFPCF
jgi:hypothetical protein